MPAESTTAYQHWDAQWRTPDGRAGWVRPQPWVMATVARLRAAGARRVLDLGCGVGRHALAFARMGLQTFALDRSEAGLSRLRDEADAAGLTIDIRHGDVTELPYPAGSFDYVLACNVVYHGDEQALAAILAEVHRVLRPGGHYQATMISQRHREYGTGIEISRNTFVQPAATDDKTHPHLYLNDRDVLRTHAGFAVLEMLDQEQGSPGSYHWHLLFERTEHERR